jgi:hypothetical protein
VKVAAESATDEEGVAERGRGIGGLLGLFLFSTDPNKARVCAHGAPRLGAGFPLAERPCR